MGPRRRIDRENNNGECVKIKFTEENLKRYSFRDLEYGVELLKDQLQDYFEGLYELTKSGAGTSVCKMHCEINIDPIKLKIALVENEIGERMLTGNDDGMLERELLGG